MALDTIFRIILGALFITVVVIRKLFDRNSAAFVRKGLREDRDTRGLIVIQSLLLTVSNLAMIVYLINPDWMTWSSISLSDGVRWAGVAAGFLGTELLIWTHRVLGDNFFGGMKLRRGHELIMSGPYTWVRHPMYTAFLALGISWFLLSGNWFIAGFWLTSTSLVVLTRLGEEERMMVDEFGDEYRKYMKRTGRFLPKL